MTATRRGLLKKSLVLLAGGAVAAFLPKGTAVLAEAVVSRPMSALPSSSVIKDAPAASGPMRIYGYIATGEHQTDGYVWDMDYTEGAVRDWIKGGGAMREPGGHAFAFVRTDWGIYIAAEVRDPWTQQCIDDGTCRGLAMVIDLGPGWSYRAKQANPDGPWTLRDFVVVDPFISPTPTDTGATIDLFVRPDQTIWTADSFTDQHNPRRLNSRFGWQFPRTGNSYPVQL